MKREVGKKYKIKFTEEQLKSKFYRNNDGKIVTVMSVYLSRPNMETKYMVYFDNGEYVDAHEEELIPIMEFPELKTGYIVKLRDGGIYIVYTNVYINKKHSSYDFIFANAINKDVFYSFDSYNCQLRHKSDSNKDVVRIGVDTSKYPLFSSGNIDNDGLSMVVLWEEEIPSKEMTIQEIEDILGYKVKIVK